MEKLARFDVKEDSLTNGPEFSTRNTLSKSKLHTA